jgi:hypothetical protein
MNSLSRSVRSSGFTIAGMSRADTSRAANDYKDRKSLCQAPQANTRIFTGTRYPPAIRTEGNRVDIV